MRINVAKAGTTRRGDLDHFTGDVWMDDLADPNEQNPLSVLKVHFAPGARTGWHQHPMGQILHVTEGFGLIQERGGAVRTLRAGHNAVAPSIVMFPCCQCGALHRMNGNDKKGYHARLYGLA